MGLARLHSAGISALDQWPGGAIALSSVLPVIDPAQQGIITAAAFGLLGIVFGLYNADSLATNALQTEQLPTEQF